MLLSGHGGELFNKYNLNLCSGVVYLWNDDTYKII